jgi:multiple RNA-binding domain-containing protein 1
MPEHAVKAYSELDGTVFHGRMMHLLPGKAKVNAENGNHFLLREIYLKK